MKEAAGKTTTIGTQPSEARQPAAGSPQGERSEANWQRGRMRAASVLANAKPKAHQDASGRAGWRVGKVQVLTRGDLPRESVGEVSRGRSSVEARRKAGGAKGRSNQLRAQPTALQRGERPLERHGAATAAASVDWQAKAEPVQLGRAGAGEAESSWGSQGDRKR